MQISLGLHSSRLNLCLGEWLDDFDEALVGGARRSFTEHELLGHLDRLLLGQDDFGLRLTGLCGLCLQHLLQFLRSDFYLARARHVLIAKLAACRRYLLVQQVSFAARSRLLRAHELLRVLMLEHLFWSVVFNCLEVLNILVIIHERLAARGLTEYDLLEGLLVSSARSVIL